MKRNAVNNYVGQQCEPRLSHANWDVIFHGHGCAGGMWQRKLFVPRYVFCTWSVKCRCAHATRSEIHASKAASQPGVAMDLGAGLWEMQWPCSYWERLPRYTPLPPSPRRREGHASSPIPPSPGCNGSVMAARAWRELTQDKKRHRLRERVGGGWVPDTS